MTLVIPPGFGSAAYTFTSDTGTPPFIVTCGHDISAFGGDFVEAANTLFTYFSQRWAALLDNALTLDRVTLAVGADGPGGSVESDLTPVPMTRSGTTGAMAESVILRKTSDTLGRRGRGRMFLPGAIQSGEVDEGGNVVGTRLTAINAAANLWLGDMTGGATPLLETPPVILHSQAPTDPTPIVGFAAASLVGWIRGRIR